MSKKIDFDFITYKGQKFEVVNVDAVEIDPDFYNGCNFPLTIADFDLWKALTNGTDDLAGNLEEVIDNKIYYYCDSGFISSHPSLEQIKEYFAKVA